MNEITLNREEILDYQKNKDPYLMIDCATSIIPGKSAKGYKDLKQDEWFFKVHWENDPNMPGMLQLESITQMCALSIFTLDNNKGKVVYLTSINKVRFFHKVLPSNRLHIETEILKFNRGLAECKGIAKIGAETVCKAEFNLVLPK